MKLNAALLTLAFVTLTAGAAEPIANPHANMGMPGMGPHEIKLTQTGKVLSTINVPEYTYIEVSQDKKTRWLAVGSLAVKKGDTIRFDEGMMMNNFYSKTLKRNFPSVAFVSRVVIANDKK